MLKSYSPLSSAVSCEFPERLAAVTSEHEITVCETYLRAGIPYVVLSHLLWDFRVHFAVRWMVREVNAPAIALLEVVDGNHGLPPQVFVHVTGPMCVKLVPHAQFNRMVEKVFRSIVTAQHLSRLATNQKLVSDVRRSIGLPIESALNNRRTDPTPYIQALICTQAV
ncbi:MAG: hypothetical protein JST89_26295 [Cyanobacteria bacterium SZAS-4]|nr:hypothetical protein [Cyanobacteria bacterium SZAS-4]